MQQIIILDDYSMLSLSLWLIVGWPHIAGNVAKKWFETFESWSNFGNYKVLDGCLLIISYENLLSQLREQLIRIGEFLGVKEEFLKGKHLDCVIENSQGLNKRKKYKVPEKIFDSKFNQTIAIYKERVNVILSYLNAGFVV